MADQRRLKILEAMEAAEGVEDDDVDNEEEDVDEGRADERRQQVADERVRSAFKNLVSRLRQSVLQSELVVRTLGWIIELLYTVGPQWLFWQQKR